VKKLRFLFVLISLYWLPINGQPILNQRYVVNETTNSNFTSVISNDTCYYVGGIQASLPGLKNLNSSFIKFSFNGEIDSLSTISFDTLGVGFWRTSEIINTLDGNFSCLALTASDSGVYSFMFLKLNVYGDLLDVNYLPQFFTEDKNNGKEPSTLIQNSDSSYFGLIHVQNDTNFLGAVTLFRLDKHGELLYRKNYYGISLGSYNTLRSASMVRYSDTTLIIGCAYRKDYGDNDEKRHHTKLLIVDTLGNLIDEHTYWEDTLALDCYGLTKTADGGLIYCGRIGRFYPEGAGIGYLRYRGQIVKLNADFTVDWKLIVGDWTASPYIGLRKILQLNETEFVMVGFMRASNEESDYNQYGWLIKFNIDGEIIWERKYLKITHDHLAPNYPTHELYDVDITSDGGFVMVGQATNYYEDNGFLYGQKAWLLKVDKFGCLVPDCQLFSATGNPLEIDPPKDTLIVNPPKEEPIIWLYPNPAGTNLFYYHHQENFQYGTAYIYNTAGEVVQKWEISANDITYDIDVSQLAAGNYFLRVFNMLGEPLQTERFVKV